MNNSIKRSLIGGFALILGILAPQVSYAWDGHHNNHRHGRHHHNDYAHRYDRHYHGDSFFNLSFSVWPERYYRRAVVYNDPQVLLTTPVYQPVVTQAIVAVPAVTTTEESVTMNVPNIRGGVTLVKIRKFGRGFAGPQNEYYSEFPSIAQLQEIYGK